MSTHNHNGLNKNKKGLVIALIITVIFMFVELIGGFLSGSLALISDAGHMITDAFAIGFSIFAFKMAERPATETKTYGYHRLEVMAAFINGIILTALSLIIFYEAYGRIVSPQKINGILMLSIASIGFIANIIGIILLKESQRDNINTRGAFLHIVGDAISSIGVIAGGLFIIFRNWYFMDPLISILIGGIILRSAVGLIIESGGIMLEYVPRGIKLEEVTNSILGVRGVLNVHDLHVWTITSGFHAMSTHVQIDDQKISNATEMVHKIERILGERYNINHATIQLECETCRGILVCSAATKSVNSKDAVKEQDRL